MPFRQNETDIYIPDLASRTDYRGYLWNWESALTATTAGLLGIWAVTQTNAKYSNPYEFMDKEVMRIDSLKALGELWQRPELKTWHHCSGDWWGPVIMHLRQGRRWMTIEQAFSTGRPHGFLLKSAEIDETWKRAECDCPKDTRKIFTQFVEGIQQVCKFADTPPLGGLWETVDLKKVPVVEFLSGQSLQAAMNPSRRR
jgi:hypothetical protein